MEHGKLDTMITLGVFLPCFALAATKTAKHAEVRKFPEGFKFGAATASYPVEGAWNEDGKSTSIWDVVSHRYKPCAIAECYTGDVADDSYHQVKRDVEMMRELGLDYYRFSLSWTRILPTSFPGKINEAGVQYYNNLINEMMKYNIQPMITLYHWDLPQKLQKMGGWTNPHMVDWFSDYARVCFELFSDRVRNWITINEPKEVCYNGYAAASLAPLLGISGIADYLCAKNLLLAHAKAYHIFNDEFRIKYGGIMGIAISASWHEPASGSMADAAGAEAERQFNWGMYINPIFSEKGDFPDVMKRRIAAKSTKQGYLRSRLPKFSVQEINYIKGSADYLGINHFSSYMSTRNASVRSYYVSPSMYDDISAISYTPEWKTAASSWLKVVPWGFYKLLTYIRIKYNNPPIYITENGFSTRGGLEDDDRISYYYEYLDAMLDAIEEESSVLGYTAWSLMDNFAWLQGYTERFGLYEVNYSDPKRSRTARKSAFAYKQIVRSRQLDTNYVPPKHRHMTIDGGH